MRRALRRRRGAAPAQDLAWEVISLESDIPPAQGPNSCLEVLKVKGGQCLLNSRHLAFRQGVMPFAGGVSGARCLLLGAGSFASGLTQYTARRCWVAKYQALLPEGTGELSLQRRHVGGPFLSRRALVDQPPGLLQPGVELIQVVENNGFR